MLPVNNPKQFFTKFVLDNVCFTVKHTLSKKNLVKNCFGLFFLTKEVYCNIQSHKESQKSQESQIADQCTTVTSQEPSEQRLYEIIKYCEKSYYTYLQFVMHYSVI